MTSKPAPWTPKAPWTYTDYAADKLFVCLTDGPMGAPVVAIQVGHTTDPVHVVPDDIPALIQALADLHAHVTDYIEGGASNA